MEAAFVDAFSMQTAPGTIDDWRRWGMGALVNDSESARTDAELLLAYVLQCERDRLVFRGTEALDAAVALRFAGLIERRLQGEPVAYLVGGCGFWNLDLAIDARVLVPRPDTETLVEWSLELLREMKASPQVADLGTGSGAIALALASECPQAQLIATDASADALAVARENGSKLRLTNTEFRLGSWFAPLTDQRFDLILSNPPYIAEGDLHLPALRFEPRRALVSGPEGLNDLRHLVSGAREHLLPDGRLLLEHGAEQGAAVRALMQQAGYLEISTRRDFGDRERVTAGRAP